MVKIPYIKIPGVRVGSIVPTSNIVTGGATPAPPTPITYLTQWKIVGNSEVHGQEIWSCGEYNATDGKWHILAKPLGSRIADIALDEPLRKVNDVADAIEFPSGTEGKALVTRRLFRLVWEDESWKKSTTPVTYFYCNPAMMKVNPTIICEKYPLYSNSVSVAAYEGFGLGAQAPNNALRVVDNTLNHFDIQTLIATNKDVKVIAELATPTTELVDAPQIQEADSYSCVISQGGKAVSWSSFTPNPS